MQVGVDVTCMYTNFGGCDFFGFGDIATFKNGQISLSTHGLYSPWSSKNLIDQNRLKKIIQVGVDVTYMHTNFGGCDLFGFGDIATFKNGQISLSTHGLYSPWSSKNLIDQNRLKKIIQVGVDVTYMHTNFGGCDFFGFGDIATFKNGQISLSTHGLYSPWSSKNLIDQNRLKKIIQVGVDVTYMHTNFGGCDFFGFGDIATFKNGQISLSTHGLYSPWSSKNLIDQNRLKKNASRCWCNMHAH